MTPKRDRAILHCRTCGTDKPAAQFYAGAPSICMPCKRIKANEYKRRTNYNARYRQAHATPLPLP